MDEAVMAYFKFIPVILKKEQIHRISLPRPRWEDALKRALDTITV
jgi:hypothetical protein